MKYFLFTTGNPSVTGPFELDEIEARFRAGGLSGDTLAIAETPEGLSGRNWLPLHAIPGFGQQRPKNLPPREASPPPALALPSPTELFPARLWRKPQRPPEQISFCPFCGQRADGPAVRGEIQCGQCGRAFYRAKGTNRAPAPTPSWPVSLLLYFVGFIVGFIGGLVAQYSSLFIMVPLGFLGVPNTSRTPNRRVSAARRPPRATAFGKIPGRPPTATEFQSRRVRSTSFGREKPSPRPWRQRDRRPTTKPERRRSRRSGFSRKNNRAPAR